MFCMVCIYCRVVGVVWLHRYATYPELDARMRRFGSSGRILDDRALRQLDLNRSDLEEFSREVSQRKLTSLSSKLTFLALTFCTLSAVRGAPTVGYKGQEGAEPGQGQLRARAHDQG
jgi:hypothetical protein